MKKTFREKRIGQLFRLSIFLKGLHSALEILAGLLLMFISPGAVTKFVIWLTRDELMEDPHNLIASYLLHLAKHLSVSTVMFGAFYLLSDGIIKLVLVIALLKNRLWAYPWALAIFSLFIAYLICKLTFTYSVGLLLLAFFDLIVIWLIGSEYRIVRKYRVKKIVK